VQAAHWIPVEEVRVISNGFVDSVFDGTTTPTVRPPPNNPTLEDEGRGHLVRFEAELPVSLAQDTYFIVEAGSRLDPPSPTPEFVDIIVPGNEPIAFTNPIFVDLAGDGFDPPGLPVLGPAAATATAAAAAGLDAQKQQEVQQHFPIHRIRISESAVAEALAQ
jgi:hypothetical protein